jgi:hypothetical protein
MTGPLHQSEQKERLAELLRDLRILNERANSSTLSQFTVAELADEGGRFAKQSQVNGTKPITEYPRLPSDSFPAQASAVPNEPPLGFSVDAMEPLGTQAEIERSLRSLSTNEAGVGCGDGGDDVGGTPRSSPFPSSTSKSPSSSQHEMVKAGPSGAGQASLVSPRAAPPLHKRKL